MALPDEIRLGKFAPENIFIDQDRTSVVTHVRAQITGIPCAFDSFKRILIRVDFTPKIATPFTMVVCDENRPSDSTLSTNCVSSSSLPSIMSLIVASEEISFQSLERPTFLL